VKSNFLLPLLLVLLACQKESNDSPVKSGTQSNELLVIPEGFPEMKFPVGNEFSKKRWDLGKKFFYEKRFSIDQSLSCGSCHKPSLAFADDQAVSKGVFDRPGSRNAPSLANVGYHPYLLREGSVPTLEMQVLVPIQEHNEFNHNIVKIAEELNADSTYRKLSVEAYNREVDGFVISRALSVFQRTIISGNSDFDKYQYQGKSNALNSAEKRGMELFFGDKANCSGCHSGFNFSNYSFENTGLDSVYLDNGRYIFTNDSSDLATFKVPSLRNVGVTAPYMHDGRFSSLEEVINHYNNGGFQHQNKSVLIKPLYLSQQEKTDLIAFLNSLTDYEFITSSKWK
jgi:cytochrome c peroxidase